MANWIGIYAEDVYAQYDQKMRITPRPISADDDEEQQAGYCIFSFRLLPIRYPEHLKTKKGYSRSCNPFILLRANTHENDNWEATFEL